MQRDDAQSRRGRQVALIIAMVMVLWMAAQWLGGKMGWPLGVALALDGAAFVAFGWAMMEAVSIWRARKDEES